MARHEMIQTVSQPLVTARLSHENQSPVVIDHPNAAVLVERIANRHIGIPTDSADHESLFGGFGLGGRQGKLMSLTSRHLTCLS